MDQFSTEKITQDLPALGSSSNQDFNEDTRKYIEYYGLDMTDISPGIIHRVEQLHHEPYQVILQSFIHPSPIATIMVCHGYYDHTGIYDHIIRLLLEHQYSVIIYDLPGHGLSSGARATISNFDTYQQLLLKVIAAIPPSHSPLHLIGQSTGAAIINDCLLSHPQEMSHISKVIALAPLVRSINWHRNRILHSIVSTFTDYLERNFVTNSHDHEFLYFLKNQDPLQPKHLSAEWVGALKKWLPKFKAYPASKKPLYIIQGKEDGTVDWKHNIKVLTEKFPNVEVDYLEEGRHQLVNESEEIRMELNRMIISYLQKP